MFEFVAALDHSTCDLCGEMDGKVFKMSEYQVGVTAEPLHPCCRCTAAPYFEDMAGLGERYARDIGTGKTYKVPSDMTYKQWKAKQDEKYGAGSVDLARKKEYNKSADKAQYQRYKEALGKNAPKTFEDFQNIKYSEKYTALKLQYADARIQKNIRSGKVNLLVLDGKQGKHIKGHNNFILGKSYLNEGVDVQSLVNKYAGFGTIKRDSSGKWSHKELVVTDSEIGSVVSMIDGTETPTKAFVIHYSKKGVHIVPAKEVM